MAWIIGGDIIYLILAVSLGVMSIRKGQPGRADLLGPDGSDPLFLQVKEADASVLSP